jgi:hypothetical protein
MTKPTKSAHNDNDPDVAAMTVSQLMRRWQCSRKVILAAHARGDLAMFKVAGKNWRVLLDEVKRYESRDMPAKHAKGAA